MSAAHQIKKAKEAKLLDNFLADKSKKRTVDGIVYLTRKDARIARDSKRK